MKGRLWAAPSEAFVDNGPTPDTPALGAEAIINNGEGNGFLHILHCNFALCCNFETCARLNFFSPTRLKVSDYVNYFIFIQYVADF